MKENRFISLAFFLSVLAAMILLNGCGVRAETLLQIEADQSGKREMKCTLNKADVENYMVDGIDGLTYIIRQNIPPEMEYNIIADGRDLVLDFEINFKNLLEYKEKTNHILGVTSDRVMVCRNNEFGEMVQIWEDYTTRDLLGWLIKVLMAYHVIEEDQDIKVTGEQTSLRISGKDIPLDEEAGSHIIYSSGEDYGAGKIEMVTENENDTFHRKIILLFSDQIPAEKVKGYFKKYPDFSYTVTNEGGSIRVECEISRKDFSQLQDKTGELIGGTLTTEEINYHDGGTKEVSVAEQYDFTSVQSIENCEILCEESRLGTEEKNVKVTEQKKINPVIKYQYTLNANYNKIMVTTDLTHINAPARQIEFYLDGEMYKAYETEFNHLLMQNDHEKIKVSEYTKGDEHVFVWYYNGNSLQELNEIESDVLGTECQSVYQRNDKQFFVNFFWKDHIDLTKTSPFGSANLKNVTYSILIPEEAASLDQTVTQEASGITEWEIVDNGKYRSHADSATIDVKGILEVKNILFYAYLIFLIALLLITFLVMLIFMLLKKGNKSKES